MARKRYSAKPKAAIIIFIIVIAYAISFSVMILFRPTTAIYEVVAGGLSQTYTARGLVMRQEKVYNAENSGTISYFQNEGARVKVDDPIYAMGNVEEELGKDKTQLTSTRIDQLRSALKSYVTNYDTDGFGSLYDTRNMINTILVSAHNDVTNGGNDINTVNAQVTGYVEYRVDGQENINEDSLSDSMFDKNNEIKPVKTADNNKVEAGKPAYKIVTSEDWNIYIKLDDSIISEYGLDDVNGVSLRLGKNNVVTRGNFEILEKNGKKYGKITLNKYIEYYLSDRYANIEITSNNVSGLKIPNSSLAVEDMYVVPADYLTKGASGEYGFFQQNGSNVTFITPVITKTDNENCYIRTRRMSSGTVLKKPDSSETYTVGKIERLTGVYSVNTGYTVFKPVEILDQNKEYSIIKYGYEQSLSIYDRILLNAADYSSDEVVY
ncbi:HlyD family efflux transporter periplasmic adaptor subunit [Howardella ureilytica]|nr:hypothetical protein [Lachnospiraceae bacterium]MDY2956466.1 HlyD family efflux transporter periplasmic adaptor subunit [Lachnospiraceae bacterium]